MIARITNVSMEVVAKTELGGTGVTARKRTRGPSSEDGVRTKCAV